MTPAQALSRWTSDGGNTMRMARGRLEVGVVEQLGRRRLAHALREVTVDHGVVGQPRLVHRHPPPEEPVDALGFSR